MYYCQALVQVQAPVPTDPQVVSRIKVPPKRKKEVFGARADTKITWTWATHHPTTKSSLFYCPSAGAPNLT